MDVTAMVIGSQPAGENDRRIVLLTRESGRLSAFARGARRPGSPLMAATGLFAFGIYRLQPGRSAYSVREAEVENYFSYFRTHVESALLGQYFCEVMDYCTRENNDESRLLLLLYQSLRALESGKFTDRLVRTVFELKTVAIEGELRQPEHKLSPAADAALRHIAQSDIAKLYTFYLEEQAQEELAALAGWEMNLTFEYHRFRSLDILRGMGIS